LRTKRRRRLIIAAAVAALVSIGGVAFVWNRIGWAFRDDPGPFLGGIEVGMDRDEFLSTHVAQVAKRVPAGGKIPAFDQLPSRDVDRETWVYICGPFTVHRFAIEFEGDKLVRITHEKQ
jgi:hypothetical protein